MTLLYAIPPRFISDVYQIVIYNNWWGNSKVHQTSMVTSLDEATKINKVTVNFGISKFIFIGLNYNISRSHKTAKGETVAILIVELIKVTHSKIFRWMNEQLPL